MSLKITYSFLTGQFRELMRERYGDVLSAVGGAFKEAESDLKKKARGAIASGGLSKKWQNALRVNSYPRGGRSLSAALYMFHKISYAHVFEDGAEIAGKPYLWLPLPNVPKKLGRDKMTPENYIRKIGPLVSMKGSKPLLGGGTSAKKKGGKVTLSALKKGAKGGRTIPLFFGVRSVTIKSKFKTREAAESVRDSLATLYFKHFKG